MSELRLMLRDYGGGRFFATRQLAALVRADTEALLDEHPGRQLTLDFIGVVAVTVTFADELVANLCVKYGNRILLTGTDAEILDAISTALARRAER